MQTIFVRDSRGGNPCDTMMRLGYADADLRVLMAQVVEVNDMPKQREDGAFEVRLAAPTNHIVVVPILEKHGFYEV